MNIGILDSLKQVILHEIIRISLDLNSGWKIASQEEYLLHQGTRCNTIIQSNFETSIFRNTGLFKINLGQTLFRE